jgi:uncharacterized protein YqgC (DUF456 family)
MAQWLELLGFGFTLLLMLVGLFGLLIPIFPGTEIIWLTALAYGLLNGFGTLGGWIFAGITILAVLAAVADNILINAGAVKGGASWSSMFAGIASGILGTLFFPPFGGLVAAPLVVFLLEAYRRRKTGDPQPWENAWRALRGMAAGWGMALILRFSLGVLMIIFWVLWDWLG